MTTFTREQLIEWAQRHKNRAEEYLGAVPNAEYGLKDLALAEIALAAMQQEPVAINDDMAFAFCRAISDEAVGAGEVEDIKTGLRAAFANITAPPAPVVPDGYVMVPATANIVMIKAGGKAAREYMEEYGGNSPQVIYQAMLAAAPQQEVKS